MRNKRGAAIATNTIIFLVIGLVVLGLLVYGFAAGFGQFADVVGGENVDDIVNGCKTSCATQSIYGYCSQTRTLVDEEGTEIEQTCYKFATEGEYAKFGVQACSGLMDDCEKLEKDSETTPEATTP